MRINEAGDSIAQRAQRHGGASASGQPASASKRRRCEPSARKRAHRPALRPTTPSPYANRHEAAQPVHPAPPLHLWACASRARGLSLPATAAIPTPMRGYSPMAACSWRSFMAVILLVIGTRKIRLEEAHHQPHHAHGALHWRRCACCCSPGQHCRRLLAERAFLAMRGRHVLRIVRHLLLAAPRTRDVAAPPPAVCVQRPLPSARWGFTLLAHRHPTASTRCRLSLPVPPPHAERAQEQAPNDIESFTPNDSSSDSPPRCCRASASSRRRQRASACSPSWTASCAATPTVRPSRSTRHPGCIWPLTIAICVIVISLMMHKRKRHDREHVHPLELFACAALVLYAAFPDIARTSARCSPPQLNALLVAFTW